MRRPGRLDVQKYCRSKTISQKNANQLSTDVFFRNARTPFAHLDTKSAVSAQKVLAQEESSLQNNSFQVILARLTALHNTSLSQVALTKHTCGRPVKEGASSAQNDGT